MIKEQSYIVTEIFGTGDKRISAFEARGVREARKKFRQWFPNKSELARYRLYKFIDVA